VRHWGTFQGGQWAPPSDITRTSDANTITQAWHAGGAILTAIYIQRMAFRDAGNPVEAAWRSHAGWLPFGNTASVLQWTDGSY